MSLPDPKKSLRDNLIDCSETLNAWASYLARLELDGPPEATKLVAAALSPAAGALRYSAGQVERAAERSE